MCPARVFPHSIPSLFLYPVSKFLCRREMALAAAGLLHALPVGSAQLLLGLPSHIALWHPASKSSPITAPLYLPFLQGILLLPGGNTRRKRTQDKVEVWVSLLYQQMGSNFLALPVRNQLSSSRMDNGPGWNVAEMAFSPDCFSLLLSSAVLSACGFS